MQYLVVLFICLFLFACEEVKTNDLTEFMANTIAQEHQIDDKSPLSLDHIPVVFTQQQVRSPFFKPTFIKTTFEQKQIATGCLQPDLKRKKEPLESFSLNDLTMRGTLKIHKQWWAIIESPNGLFYKVKRGSYLGSNTGIVVQVLENKISVQELKLANGSCWEKQATEIKLLLK